jgi:chorismate mutase/prephenate dehydrogenase
MVALTIIDHLMRQRLLASRSRLENLRDTIDLIDRNMLLLLAERQGLVRQIGAIKRRRGKLVRDRKREKSVLRTQRAGARDLGLDEEMIEKIFLDVFGLARASQNGIVGR